MSRLKPDPPNRCSAVCIIHTGCSYREASCCRAEVIVYRYHYAARSAVVSLAETHLRNSAYKREVILRYVSITILAV